MRLVETVKFKKLRKRIRDNKELEALRGALKIIRDNPEIGKKLKGEFKELRSYKYSVYGQSKRLIYKIEQGCLVLLSFGPREGSYK
jgi:hypothetical protein